MKKSTDKLVQQFLDGSLDSDEEAEALRRIASDPDARSLLRFERQLAQILAEDTDNAEMVPPDFSDRVMQSISEEKASEPAFALWDQLHAAWTAMLQPRRVALRPVYALPLLIAVVGLALWLGSPATTPDAPETQATMVQHQQETHALVRFMYVEEEAESVAVAGDFSNWDPISLTPQEAEGQTVWTTLMNVPPGEHRYMFIIDGEEWVTDPLAPQVREDGFGNRNAILSL